MSKEYRYQKVEDMYVERYAPNPTTVELGEHLVPMPIKPPLEEMLNFDKPKSQQKFRRTHIPKELRSWPKEHRDAFVAGEYHKRKHGIWVMIKGKPYYIPGICYFFLNYWICEYGGLPEFRMEAVEFFWFWRMCERDPNCYGMLDFKARRIGDTEKALCILYDGASRIKFSRSGMQNTTDEDAYANFARILESHNQMVWFFKPINRGSDKVKDALVFDYPPLRVTRDRIKKAQEDRYKNAKKAGVQPVKSMIDYQPTKLGKYDGKRLLRFHLDEAGKMEHMNPSAQLDIIKPCMHLFGGMKIIGKAIVTTTVEEIGKGQSLEYAKQLWDDSSPYVLNENGRTVSGLYRLFRSVEKAAVVDAYGFHKSDEMKEFIQNEIKSLRAKNKLQKLASFQRKNPITIEHVLQPSAEDCKLLPHILDRRIHQITNDLSYKDAPVDEKGRKIVPKTIRGELVWLEGHIASGRVKWVATPNGKWAISQHPKFPNRNSYEGGYHAPGCSHLYSIGVDPYDHVTDNPNRSKGAVAVYRRFDMLDDGALEVDQNGEIVDAGKMVSDQFVCTYLFRHDEPAAFYEDVLKTAVYYGTPILYESNKTGIREYFNNKNYWKFLMMRPDNTKSSRNPGANKYETGSPSSTGVISMYVEMIKDHISKRWETAHHLELLKDWRKFTGDNRSERDLSVASGFALIALGRRYKQVKKAGDRDLTYTPWRKFRRPA